MQASALKSANKIIRNVIKGELLRGPKTNPNWMPMVCEQQQQRH
jgi:hypothetical protein